MEQIPKSVLSAIFSNLSKAAEKQDHPDESKIFEKLSGEYWKPDPANGGLDALKAGIEIDLSDNYAGVSSMADDLLDSGTQRCVKWGNKVSSIQRSLLSRYASKGEAIFEDKNLYVCEACGFIALSEDFPELCPICKAPASRFSRVK